MSKVISIASIANRKRRNNIERLRLVPKNKLFEKFLYFKKNISNNYDNIDFILWGEALFEEVSFRKLTSEFEREVANMTALKALN